MGLAEPREVAARLRSAPDPDRWTKATSLDPTAPNGAEARTFRREAYIGVGVRRRKEGGPVSSSVALILALKEVIQERVGAALASNGFHPLGRSPSRFLGELGPGAHPKELAQRLGVSKSAVAQTAERLEALGYVKRLVDDLEGRYRWIRPTGKTRRANEVVSQCLVEIEDEWRRLMGPQRTADLLDALTSLEAWRQTALPAPPGDL